MSNLFMFFLVYLYYFFFFFFSSRRRHTRCGRDWSSDVCLPISLTGQSFSEEEFKIEFLHLVKKLNDRVLSQIHSEKNIDKRSSIQNFPSQFESLENDISNFVRQCFSGHRFNLPPLLRGVYFTS